VSADSGSLPLHVQFLLDALKHPERCTGQNDVTIDSVIRSARAAQLLAELAVRFARSGIELTPERPLGRQLLGAVAQAAHRRQMIRYEADCVVRALGPLKSPLILLKGAAYIAQSLKLAEGRLPRDFDLMVVRAQLDAAEHALHDAGWRFDQELDDYDQHYYRAWTHELPAMRFPGHAAALDLHHTILPPIGRLRPNTQALFDESIPVGDGKFRVLCPADQVLHAAAHLFQDSDCVGRLRDLVDIDGLVREFSAKDRAFWDSLYERACLHQLGRPLWYSLTLCCRWLDTPAPEEAASKIFTDFRPPALSRWLVLSLASQTLPPVDPDSEPSARRRFFATLLEFRALWLRMPPWTLAYHAFRKGQRSLVTWWKGLRTSST